MGTELPVPYPNLSWAFTITLFMTCLTCGTDLPSFLNCQNKYDPTIRTGNKLLRLNLIAGKAMLVQNHRKNQDRAGARDQKPPRYITDTNLVLGPTNRNSQLHSLL